MSETVFTFNTLQQKCTGLLKERGSRFLAFGFPVDRTETVKKHLQQLKADHPKANHHCYAYRIGTDGTNYRANDDGEPSGSAGRPILGQIDSAGLTNVLLVVVRYFGGTLLGVPGLIAAYKGVAAQCLEAAPVIEKDILFPVTLSFEYPLMHEVMTVLKQHECILYKQEMLLFCEFQAGIPLRVKEACLAQLTHIHGVRIEAES